MATCATNPTPTNPSEPGAVPSRRAHSGIGLHTAADVHFGRAERVRARHQVVLDAAYAARPERFRRPPRAPVIPDVAWINRPEEEPARGIAT